MRDVLLSVLAIVVAGGCASAPTTGSAPPAAAPRAAAAAPASTRGEPGRPIRQVLPNGLRLIVQDHRAADVVAVYLYVGVGVRYERPDQLGYSHFQEHMLFKGTDKWGPGYIDRAVEGVGGRTNATTSFDYTDFYIVVPTDALDMALQTLADMAFRSTFDPKEVDREREVIFEEANIETDNPKTAVIRQLYGLVFADNPYGAPVLGTRATMNAATSEKLKAYNKQYYTPENITLVVVGPVEPAKVRARWSTASTARSRAPATGPCPPPRRGRSPASCAGRWSAPSSRASSHWAGRRRARTIPTATRSICSRRSSPARRARASRAACATRSGSSTASR